MQIIKISDSAKKHITDLEPAYSYHSEMAPSEQLFLTELLLQDKPKKVLEVGVAAGSSSVLILNAIKDIPGSKLYSVDYSTEYYRDSNKKSGFITNEYPELEPKRTIYSGGLVSNFIEEIGGDIDFFFLDTMHVVPGELIDFLLVLPFLKKDATVVLHDTNLHTWGYWPQANVNNLLISATSGVKMVPEIFESTFYHNIESQHFDMYFPNIAAVKLDANQKDKVWDIFNLLTQKWLYIPAQEELKLIQEFFYKHYGEFYANFFENIVRYQMLKVTVGSGIEKMIDLKQHFLSDYNELLYKYVKVKYYKCKLLSKITFGNMRKRYKDKRKNLKDKLREIKCDLKGV